MPMKKSISSAVIFSVMVFAATAIWHCLAISVEANAWSSGTIEKPAVLPTALQGAVSRLLGEEDAAYHIVGENGQYRLDNPRHGLKATIGPDGFSILTGDSEWRLHLTAWERGGNRQAIPVEKMSTDANRLEIRRNGMVEWWINGPYGLEQGWTIPVRPRSDSANPLSLILAQSGSLQAKAGVDPRTLDIADVAGHNMLHYAGLTAVDARGRELPAWFEIGTTEIQVRIDDAGAAYPLQIDPWVQAASLTASDGAANDVLGSAVAASADGSTIVAGAPQNVASPGAAYVFLKPPAGWSSTTETAKLTASDRLAGDFFGTSVAISADGACIVVGAPSHKVGSNAGQGTAYVFSKPVSGWTGMTETAKLTASDGAASDQMAKYLAISGDGLTVFAGASRAKIGSNSYQGAVYVFAKGGSAWTNGNEIAKRIASDGAANDSLGYGITTNSNGTVVAAGAYLATIGSNNGQGAVYIFSKPLSGWTHGTQTAKLIASDGAAGDELGFAAALSSDGTTLAAASIGAKIGSNSGQGAVYVYTKPVAGWVDGMETAKLWASDGALLDNLGWAVAINGNGSSIMASSPFVKIGSNFSQGAVYTYTKPVTGWTSAAETAKITASDGAGGDQLGYSVALSSDGTKLVAGAFRKAVGGKTRQGVTYVFQNYRRLALPLLVK